MLKEKDPRRTIVFVRTRFSADRLAHRLRQQGHDAREIHSGLAQRRREEILAGFRDGAFPLLVATDVAARGLDIRGVTHVVNFDLPENPEDYVHRVGRTARMGEEGWAVMNDEWDFDLAPWIAKGAVRWIAPGDAQHRVIDGSSGAACPFAGLAGERLPQFISTGEVELGDLPDGVPPQPFEE